MFDGWNPAHEGGDEGDGLWHCYTMLTLMQMLIFRHGYKQCWTSSPTTSSGLWEALWTIAREEATGAAAWGQPQIAEPQRLRGNQTGDYVSCGHRWRLCNERCMMCLMSMHIYISHGCKHFHTTHYTHTIQIHMQYKWLSRQETPNSAGGQKDHALLVM